jgi:CRP/FNR family transcriptional regulator
VLHLLAVTATGEATSDLLGHVPLFAALSEEELAPVAEVPSTRRFDPDEVVFREGDFSSTCNVIRSGHARAIREYPDGRAITLARFGPGDIFGELARLAGSSRESASRILAGLAALG